MLQVLPPEFPLALERNEGETMDQLDSVDSHVEDVPVTETREAFSTYHKPLVQLPPVADSTFHFQMKFQPISSDWVFNHPSDDTVGAEFGSNDPFWRTSLGQSIYEYGTTTAKADPSVLTPLRKFIQYSSSNAEFFQKSIENLCSMGDILRRRSFSQLPHLSRTTPSRYHAL